MFIGPPSRPSRYRAISSSQIVIASLLREAPAEMHRMSARSSVPPRRARAAFGGHERAVVAVPFSRTLREG